MRTLLSKTTLEKMRNNTHDGPHRYMMKKYTAKIPSNCNGLSISGQSKTRSSEIIKLNHELLRNYDGEEVDLFKYCV